MPPTGLVGASEAPTPPFFGVGYHQEVENMNIEKLEQRQRDLLKKSTSMLDELEALGTSDGDRQRAKRLSKDSKTSTTRSTRSAPR